MELDLGLSARAHTLSLWVTLNVKERTAHAKLRGNRWQREAKNLIELARRCKPAKRKLSEVLDLWNVLRGRGLRTLAMWKPGETCGRLGIVTDPHTRDALPGCAYSAAVPGSPPIHAASDRRV